MKTARRVNTTKTDLFLSISSNVRGVYGLKMVIECCVPYCRMKASARFHNFPRNRERRQRWLNAKKVFDCEDTELDGFRKVCKRHFLPSDFFVHANGLLRLKCDSIPNQHLPSSTWLEHSYVNRRISDVSACSLLSLNYFSNEKKSVETEKIQAG